MSTTLFPKFEMTNQIPMALHGDLNDKRTPESFNTMMDVHDLGFGDLRHLSRGNRRRRHVLYRRQTSRQP